MLLFIPRKIAAKSIGDITSESITNHSSFKPPNVKVKKLQK